MGLKDATINFKSLYLLWWIEDLPALPSAHVLKSTSKSMPRSGMADSRTETISERRRRYGVLCPSLLPGASLHDSAIDSYEVDEHLFMSSQRPGLPHHLLPHKQGTSSWKAHSCLKPESAVCWNLNSFIWVLKPTAQLLTQESKQHALDPASCDTSWGSTLQGSPEPKASTAYYLGWQFELDSCKILLALVDRWDHIKVQSVVFGIF